jgi:hypothetical protein
MCNIHPSFVSHVVAEDCNIFALSKQFGKHHGENATTSVICLLWYIFFMCRDTSPLIDRKIWFTESMPSLR